MLNLAWRYEFIRKYPEYAKIQKSILNRYSKRVCMYKFEKAKFLITYSCKDTFNVFRFDEYEFSMVFIRKLFFKQLFSLPGQNEFPDFHEMLKDVEMGFHGKFSAGLEIYYRARKCGS